MRALVTGSTGFLGNHLVLSLLEKDWEVVCLLRYPLTTSNNNIDCIVADFSQPESLEKALRSAGAVEAVFHLGALLPKQGKKIPAEEFILANTVLTCRLLEFYANHPSTSFVYVSSLPVIGEPVQIPITETHPTTPLHLPVKQTLG